jgi:signal transduction histidine kinase
VAIAGTTVRLTVPRSVSRPGWPVALAFLALSAALGLVARTTLIPGTDLAAMWPSAGVTVLWLLVRRAMVLSLDTALLWGTVFVLASTTTGIPRDICLLLATTHTVQSLVIVLLMRRWLPDLWGCGGTWAIDSPRVLATYFACIALGVLVSTVVLTLGWRIMEGSTEALDALLWYGRNACGVLLVTTAGLFVFQQLDPSAPSRARPLMRAGNVLEFFAACLTSITVYVVVFVADVHSLLFLVLGVVIWCGVRFSTTTNALHMLVLGYLAVWATAVEVSGPFAHDGPLRDALLSQLFVMATAATALLMSTGLDERTALHAELMQTSAEMTYQAQLLHAVVNSMAEGLAVVDDGGRWLLRNPAATRVGGLAGDLRSLLAQAPGNQDPLARALGGETVRDMELSIDTAPGAGRILAVSAAPRPRDSVTGRARAVLVFRDATMEHARRIDLTAFASVVAHDLRNPLAAVESWTEMMAAELDEGSADPDLVRRYIDRVGSGAHRMKGLIDDLLDRATHDSALQLRRVDVAELAREVARDHGADQQVAVRAMPGVHADPALVRQVLDNLLGNALKFVPAGVEPRVTVTGRRTGSGTVAIAVADEGVGLPAGTHDDIFAAGRRLHPEYDGRGLGLAICRRIVERHGGTIGVRDNEGGRGAVFEFTLPSAD